MKKKMTEFLSDCRLILGAVNRENKRTVPLVLAGTMLEAAAPFVSIIFGARILDMLIKNASRSEIMSMVYLMIGLSTAAALISRWFARLYRISALEMEGDNKASLAVKCLTMDYRQAETQEIMDKKRRADTGSSSSGGMFSFCYTAARLCSGIFSLVYALATIAFLFVPARVEEPSLWVRCLNSPLAALLLLAVTIGATLLGFPLLRKANEIDYEIFQINAESNRKFFVYLDLSDYRMGKEVRTYGFADMLERRAKGYVNEVWKRSKKAQKKRELLKALAASTGILGLLSAYAFVGLKAMAGLATVGEVTMYVGAVTSLAAALRLIVEMFGTLDLQRKYLKEYEEFMAIPSERYDGTLPVEKRTDCDYEIEFRDVSFCYPNQTENSLSHVSFRLKTGMKLAVVGPNGAGKTTFIKLLCRLYDPTEGEILLNGIDIRKYDYKEYLSLLAVVFQDFRLFSMEIGQNVAAGVEYNAGKVWECLIKAGLEERVLQMEKGLKTGIYQKEENGVEISGGEAQKLAIARALYKEAPIVIMDEPTSALDPFSEYEIYRRFDQLVENKTSIYISHRMSSCRFCDEILVFSQGSIVQYGGHAALMAQQDGLYRKMWDAQAQYYQNNG